MSSAASPRLVFRRTRFIGRQTTPRRPASTTPETIANATAKSKSTVTSGLSRANSYAGPFLRRATHGVSSALGRIGGRTGKAIRFTSESIIPPTIYYSKVSFELGKLVFKGRNMSPPDIAAFRKYWEPVFQTLRNPTQSLSSSAKLVEGSNMGTMLNRARNISAGQMMAAGVIGAEVLGFFTVGEMIGRMKLVGYHAPPGEHGHGH